MGPGLSDSYISQVTSWELPCYLASAEWGMDICKIFFSPTRYFRRQLPFQCIAQTTEAAFSKGNIPQSLLLPSTPTAKFKADREMKSDDFQSYLNFFSSHFNYFQAQISMGDE